MTLARRGWPTVMLLLGCAAQPAKPPVASASAPTSAAQPTPEPGLDPAAQPRVTPEQAQPPKDTASAAIPERAEALAVCERYRRATEAKDVEALLALASKRYYDDAGAPNPGDDSGYKELAANLKRNFVSITGVVYRFEYDNVQRADGKILVDYRYNGSFRIGGKTREVVDANRLVLVREDGELKILSGM